MKKDSRIITTKHLIGDDKDKELARIEATNRELERKLLDIQERYAMNVEAWLHSAMIIHLPTVHIQSELQSVNRASKSSTTGSQTYR